MKNLLAAALTLTLLGGVATTAQADERNSRFEQRDHRHDDKRGHDHRNDHRNDHKSDHRGHDFKDRDFRDRDRHRDHRFDGRHDHRHDHWRHDHRHFKHNPYVKPSGYRYRAWRHGDHLPRAYRSSRYIVNDYRTYRLSAPPRGYHWVRVDNDVVLAAIASGLVANAIFGVF